MKIVLTGSKEYFATHVKEFFKMRGHEVTVILRHPENEGELAIDHFKNNPLPDCDIVIHFPEKQIISRKKGEENYKNNFNHTRIEPTRIIKEAILKMEKPPKLWISFSSVSCYPKEEEKVFKEDDQIGDDLTAKMVKEWEDAASLGEQSQTRSIILRTGLILSQHVGLLPEIIPLFKIGLGSIIGEGKEAFPWIYYKDLSSFLSFLTENEVEGGVYNIVAPQMINSRMFSEALSKIMQRKIFLKLPSRFFRKKLGDIAEIVLARSKIYPSRLLKTGFNFRYPAIYPALLDAFSEMH